MADCHLAGQAASPFSSPFGLLDAVPQLIGTAPGLLGIAPGLFGTAPGLLGVKLVLLGTWLDASNLLAFWPDVYGT